MAAFLAISVGLWTTVMQVRHKDVQFSIRYFMQLWFYVTPVIFPLSKLPVRSCPSQLALHRLSEPDELRSSRCTNGACSGSAACLGNRRG